MNFLSKFFGPPLATISAVELQEKLKAAKRPLVLDVRQPEEYREGHIQGARLVPLGELKRNLSDIPKQREIVCVCASGSRSSSATKMLAAEGFQVMNMVGGMAAWQRAQLPVKKGMSS